MKKILTLISIITLVSCGKQKTAQAWAVEAGALMAEEKFAEAIPFMKKASSLNPDCAEYHVGIAMSCIMIKDYEIAKAEYLNALPILKKQSQNDPERIDDLVILLTWLNRDEEAKIILSNAKKKFPSNKTVAMDYRVMVEGTEKYKIIK